MSNNLSNILNLLDLDMLVEILEEEDTLLN